MKRRIFSLIAGIGLTACILAGCSKTKLSQDDFSKKVLTRPAWIVWLTVGRPDEVQKQKDLEIWIYRDRTFNPENSKPDRAAWLTVKKGKVVQTAF